MAYYSADYHKFAKLMQGFFHLSQSLKKNDTIDLPSPATLSQKLRCVSSGREISVYSFNRNGEPPCEMYLNYIGLMFGAVSENSGYGVWKMCAMRVSQ